ncbi:MAG: ABC transporter permease [Clostridiales bacterium]|nr:ABC transporter permease [Clostridiales bacterium]
MQKNKIGTDSILVIFLFFSLLVVGFVFVCTDAEYNYYQQISRGFISRDAVFFNVDNPSYQEAYYWSSDMGERDESPNARKHKEAKDASFVLKNDVLDSGLTAIETMLSCAEGDYLASLHRGDLRGVYFKGDITLPPILSGRFFSEDDCLSKNPIAVIGNNYVGSTTIHDDKKYIDYLGKEYEVIGVVGLSGKSPIDNIIFVNIGSLSPEEQLNGIYYIDCSKNNTSVYDELFKRSENLIGCELKQRETPTAFIDVVSGGMYLKPYLKILLLSLGVITFLSVIIQSTNRQLIKICVMKMQGVRLLRIYEKTILRKLVDFVIGVLSGTLCIVVFEILHVFSLPVEWMARYYFRILSGSLGMMALWMLIVFAIEWRLNPKGVIQKI